jgi:hypothetical protein
MRRSVLAAVLAVAFTGPACKPGGGDVNNPSFADTHTAIEVYERLEAMIEDQKDTKQDREDAYALVIQNAGTGPDYYFARAAVAGRLAENRGLQAMGLVTEAEDYARRVRAADPDYREGAATRMLGTLYVLAPASLVAHGDSETGLELLEAEVKAHPDRLVSRLRLAEAYIALNDPDPAKEHLCMVKQGEAKLSGGDRRLLAKLLPEVGALVCEGAAPTPAASPDAAPAPGAGSGATAPAATAPGARAPGAAGSGAAAPGAPAPGAAAPGARAPAATAPGARAPAAPAPAAPTP